MKYVAQNGDDFGDRWGICELLACKAVGKGTAAVMHMTERFKILVGEYVLCLFEGIAPDYLLEQHAVSTKGCFEFDSEADVLGQYDSVSDIDDWIPRPSNWYAFVAINTAAD